MSLSQTERQANKPNVCEDNDGHNKYNNATQEVLILTSISVTRKHGTNLSMMYHVATHAISKSGGAIAHVMTTP